MSLLRKLERRDYTGTSFLPPDAIPTNGQLSTGGFGGWPVSGEAAMRHWAVWACVRIVADVLSTLPIDVYTGDTQPVSPTPSRLVNPSAYATKIQWLWQVGASLLLHGNAYGLYGAFDRLGYPTQVDLISPAGVTAERDKATGRKVFKVHGQTLSTDQVWHLPGPQFPGDLEGMSPIRYASKTIGLGLDAEQFGSDLLRNGIKPGAVFSMDAKIDDDQAAKIKQKVSRSAQNGELLVLGAGGKLSPWQVTASDSQFLETQRMNAVSVSQIFGVPPEMIGAATSGQSVTYANREQRAQDFLNNAVNPWLARLEEALSAWFPRGTYVKFNTGALLRSDLLTRFQAYQIGIRNGFQMPSEARELEDWQPISGLDDRPLPGAVTAPVPPTQGAPNA